MFDTHHRLESGFPYKSRTVTSGFPFFLQSTGPGGETTTSHEPTDAAASSGMATHAAFLVCFPWSVLYQGGNQRLLIGKDATPVDSSNRLPQVRDILRGRGAILCVICEKASQKHALLTTPTP